MSDKVEKIYNTKYIVSGKHIEIYRYKGYIRTGGESKNKNGSRGKNEITPEQKAENRLKNRLANLNNAKNKIVRLVSCNDDLVSFITVTYKCNMQDLRKAKRHISLMFKRMKNDFANLKYLYVLEFQDRGAVHFHILTNFPVPTGGNAFRKTEDHKAYEREFARKYWKRGYVDCRNLLKEGNTSVAKYMSAYLTKDLYTKDLGGINCFQYSRNLLKPIITTTEDKFDYAEYLNIEGYKLQYHNNYNMKYFAKDGTQRNNNVNYFDFLEE